jgi:uncharacterized protein (UPF0332 family)
MKFDYRHFEKFDFTIEQVRKYLINSTKDLSIAKKVDIPDVKFNYAYSSFLKAGIALLSFHRMRAKSVPGHQVKIIQMMSRFLKDDAIEDMGNLMRAKRNTALYGEGIEVTDVECRSYIEFAEEVSRKVKGVIEG